jgi:hypothetical protein
MMAGRRRTAGAMPRSSLQVAGMQPANEAEVDVIDVFKPRDHAMARKAVGFPVRLSPW